MSSFLAGAAVFRIDPPLPADPQGFVRRATAVRTHGEELSVRACVIRTDSGDVAIIAADLVNLDIHYARRIRELIESETGVPYDNILLNSSHSHASMWPRVDGKVHGEFDALTDGERAYFERLPYDFVSVVVTAIERLQPARISGAVGHAPGQAVNRRERTEQGTTILGWNREGFIDEDVPTLRIDAHDGTPIATIVGFGCHPVALGGEVPLTGPDFPGRLRADVERMRGGICLFIQGAGGNVLPLEAFDDVPGVEQTMGARLALEAVHAVADHDPRVIEIEHIAYGSVTPISLYRRRAAAVQPAQPVGVRRLDVDLPLLEPPSREELEQELAERRAQLDSLRAEGAGRDVTNPIQYHINWLQGRIAEAKEGPLRRVLPGEVWAARFGDTAIAAAPGEIFTELGAEVRRRSPFPTTIFAGYSQGVLGYVATAEEYPFGGYEPSVSHRGYGHAAPFTPEAGRILVERCVELLESLAAEAPPSRWQ